ncbi:hypothetical protein CAOG_009473 [Capsaspora owczarzaki ATCC 30864]|uniref:Uncharacterized protein n=1 Tax=Capsaspora owczarzaki (strain ATCC 30864) TaxID=595528 RepID=A0A0D2WKA6_CAPO3|nr:hypothetical protein CAOG_009473 [Capsaspora owczarzaki ATCC 30864]
MRPRRARCTSEETLDGEGSGVADEGVGLDVMIGSLHQLEGSFVFMSLRSTVKEHDNAFASLWKEYSKADARWLVSDPTVVSLEILTVFFDTFSN